MVYVAHQKRMPPNVVVKTTKVASPDLIRQVKVPCKSETLFKFFVSKIISLLQEKSPAEKGMVSAMGTRVRSAVTGQYVPKSEAVKHPKTTVTEKVKPTKK